MNNSDIATAWRDAMLVDAFRRSRRVNEDTSRLPEPSRQPERGPGKQNATEVNVPEVTTSDEVKASEVNASDDRVRERLEAARAEGERLARTQVEQELADVRARTNAEYERARALGVKAARLRRELDAELKKARRIGRTESQKVIEDAKRQASEIMAEARKSAEHVRKTARQAAEAEVRALLADLEAFRSAGADQTGTDGPATSQAA